MTAGVNPISHAHKNRPRASVVIARGNLTVKLLRQPGDKHLEILIRKVHDKLCGSAKSRNSKKKNHENRDVFGFAAVSSRVGSDQ